MLVVTAGLSPNWKFLGSGLLVTPVVVAPAIDDFLLWIDSLVDDMLFF